jgi:YgiT-type zinc finger domain-containing protein
MPENAKRHRCSNCGERVQRVRGNYLFRESGLPNVVLRDVEIMKCEACGNQDPIIPTLSKLIAVLALAVVKKPCSLSGEDVRFLRKYMAMNGETFAGLLGVDKTTLSKWENNQISIGTNSDRLIRAVVLGLGPESKEKIMEGMRNFANISEERRPVQIELDAKVLTFAYA